MPNALRPVDYRIDPFDLRLFTAILEAGTITGAASALGLSLAAASTRLKALEAQVGARLVERAKTGVTPTAAGQALARHAHLVLAELETLHLEMGRFAGGLRGSLRLLCNTSAMVDALPRVLGQVLNSHPDLDIDLQELPSDAILEALRQGAAEVGIVASHVDTRGLSALPWLDDPLTALVPSHGPLGEALSALPAISFADLLPHPFVGLPTESGLSRFLAQEARTSGQLAHHRIRVAGVDAVSTLVGSGVGVAVLPLHAARRWASDRVRAVPLTDSWANRQLALCIGAEAAQRPAVQALVEGLRLSRP